jgi:hypothetical protein
MKVRKSKAWSFLQQLFLEQLQEDAVAASAPSPRWYSSSGSSEPAAAAAAVNSITSTSASAMRDLLPELLACDASGLLRSNANNIAMMKSGTRPSGNERHTKKGSVRFTSGIGAPLRIIMYKK